MSLDARSRRFARVVALGVSISAVLFAFLPVTAGPASASLLPSCGARQSSTAFAQWGDSKSYFSMPGGGFESGTAGWAVAGGAAVVAGNESFSVAGSRDSHSLAIPSGAKAVSPTICVTMGETSIRLFAKGPGVATSVLHVQAYVQNPLTGLVLSTGFDVKGTASKAWAPTACISIPNLLGGVLGTQNLTLVFTTIGTTATWNIDDVFVDPFKSR